MPKNSDPAVDSSVENTEPLVDPVVPSGPPESANRRPADPPSKAVSLYNPHTGVGATLDPVEYAERKAYYDSAGYILTGD